ncbi:MAG: electron transfer flavoprotein subunit alpha/FixB family protein [Georgfuchsia sp.]
MDKTVCVLLETEEDGTLKDICYELANEAVSFAKDSGAKVFGILLGKQTDKAVTEAKKYGVEKLYVHDARLDPEDIASNDAKFRNLCACIDAESPALILMGQEYAGVSLSSFLAVICGYKTVSNAQKVSFSAGNIVVEKPVLNGRVLKTLKYPSGQKVAVLIKPGMLGVGNAIRKSADIALQPLQEATASDAVTAQYDAIKRERSYQVELTDRISEADVVIGVGGGVTADLMDEIVSLAKRMNAAVGGTRVGVDKGLVPYERQIGQTGKIIAPKVYIALGISGAIQHLVGMKTAKYIIAVNIDKGAPLLKSADLPCIADVRELLPELRKNIETRA